MKNNIMSLVIVGVIFVLMASIGYSEEKSSSDWVVYGEKNDGVYSYKKVNIEKDGGNHKVQIWNKKVFSNKGREQEIQNRKESELPTKGYDKLSRNLDLIEIDCKKRMKQLLSIISYDTDDKVLYSADIKREWQYIVPDSLSDFLRKQVCE